MTPSGPVPPEPVLSPITPAVLLCLLAVLIAVTAYSWRRKVWLVCAGFATASTAVGYWAWRVSPTGLVVAAAVALAVLGFACWHRWTRTAGTVTRWGNRARRTVGVATGVEVARVASALAMRRKAAVVRPSLADLSRVQQLRTRVGEVAIPLARVGFMRVWSLMEDVVCVFGGPRTGKTGWLAGRVIDAPGAALVTSTRTDLYELTCGLRTRRGPVYVFNAVGLGGLPSTVTFDPLTGCADPVTAAQRATDLLGAVTTGRGGDREFWDSQARRVLGALLHAAALDEEHRLQMRDVLRWVADPDTASREVTSLLRRSPEPAYQEDAAQFMSTNDRTRSSITSTIMPALGWLTSPDASAAAEPGRSLDVAALLRERGTVYLLGAEETQAAPLVCALTGHVAREARRLAALRPAGRLDPPLTLALDEAALISPVPLEKWSADMGGRGVCIIAAFQSRAQLLDRWGEHAAAVILNNTGSIVLFGGTRDRDDLQYWSTLAGDRDEHVETSDAHGRMTGRTVRRVPVLAPAQLANLPVGRVVLFRRGMSPAVGRAAMAWRRRDVRGEARAARRAAAAVVDAAETVTRTAEVPEPHPHQKGSSPGGGHQPRVNTGREAGDHAE